jgi:hypothetical protein
MSKSPLSRKIDVHMISSLPSWLTECGLAVLCLLHIISASNHGAKLASKIFSSPIRSHVGHSVLLIQPNNPIQREYYISYRYRDQESD